MHTKSEFQLSARIKQYPRKFENNASLFFHKKESKGIRPVSQRVGTNELITNKLTTNIGQKVLQFTISLTIKATDQ